LLLGWRDKSARNSSMRIPAMPSSTLSCTTGFAAPGANPQNMAKTRNYLSQHVVGFSPLVGAPAGRSAAEDRAGARILKRMQPRKKNSTEMTQKKTRQHVRCLRNGRAAWFFFVSSRFVGILVASFSRFGLVNYVQLCFSHLVLNFFFWWVVSFPRFGRRRLWAREGWFC